MVVWWWFTLVKSKTSPKNKSKNSWGPWKSTQDHKGMHLCAWLNSMTFTDVWWHSTVLKSLAHSPESSSDRTWHIWQQLTATKIFDIHVGKSTCAIVASSENGGSCTTHPWACHNCHVRLDPKKTPQQTCSWLPTTKCHLQKGIWNTVSNHPFFCCGNFGCETLHGMMFRV